jgi:hypothetical protein
MDNSHLALLSRTTGRLIGEREGCDIDVERVLLRARERGSGIDRPAPTEKSWSERCPSDRGARASFIVAGHAVIHKRLGPEKMHDHQASSSWWISW